MAEKCKVQGCTGDIYLKMVTCSKGHSYSESLGPRPEPPPTPTIRIPPKTELHPDENRPYSPRIKMPFGKHRGELLEDIPTDYIEWCLGNMERLSESLREEMENQLNARRGEGIPRRNS